MSDRAINELQRTAELIGYIIGNMDGEQVQEASAEIAAVQLERLADAIGVNLKRGAFGYMIGRAAENAAPLEEAPPVA